MKPMIVALDVETDRDAVRLADALSYGTLPLATPADRDLYVAGTSATVLGWGDTSDQGDASQYLMQASVPLVSDAECGQAYQDFHRSAMVSSAFGIQRDWSGWDQRVPVAVRSCICSLLRE